MKTTTTDDAHTTLASSDLWELGIYEYGDVFGAPIEITAAHDSEPRYVRWVRSGETDAVTLQSARSPSGPWASVPCQATSDQEPTGVRVTSTDDATRPRASPDFDYQPVLHDDPTVVHDHFGGSANCVECGGPCQLSGAQRLLTEMIRWLFERAVRERRTYNMLERETLLKAGVDPDRFLNRAKESTR